MAHPEGDWIKYLNNYCHGELNGSQLIERLLEFAPGEEERTWLRQWVAEERQHHQLWDDLLTRKGIPRRPMSEAFKNIYALADDFASRKDWIGSMVAATIIEHFSVAAATLLYRHADADIQRIFKKTIGDDVGHLDFDLAQLERAALTQGGRKKIHEAHTVFLKALLQWPSRPDVTDREIDILNETYQLQRSTLRRIGIKLTNITFSRSRSFKVRKRLVEMGMRF